MLKFNSRKWHAWISFVLALPILLVAITAILIAHGQTLGFRDIKVDASLMPGYSHIAVAPNDAAMPNRKPIDPHALPLAKLIRDIHSGEAMFGHDTDWIWTDIVGGTMAFLALTGVYLWWSGQRKLFLAQRARQRAMSAAQCS